MNQQTNQIDNVSIDTSKLISIIRNNLLWIILLLVLTNAIAYMVVRWTKPVYQSESILRLNIKEDANILGLPNFQEGQENVLAGEIEVIKSKLFLNKVIDNIDLNTSYYTAGDFLNDEKFGSSPLLADHTVTDPGILDTRIYVKILNDKNYQLSLGDESHFDDSPLYKYDQKVQLPQLSFRLYLTKFYDPDSPYKTYFFIINSREALLSYLEDNLTVEPKMQTAKTISIAFRDNNAIKARTLINSIDTLYLQYTDQQKNLENEQKIEWLNLELTKIESQLEGYENYIEKFTIENRTSNLDEDLKRTLSLINSLDSQRYNHSIKIREITNLQNEIQNGKINSILDAHSLNLPEYITSNLDELNELLLRRERLQLSYNESTLAIQRLDESIQNSDERISTQLNTMKTKLVDELSEINRTKSQLEQQFITLPGKSNEYNKNKRFYDLYEEFYLSLLQSKAEFEIAKAGTNTNFVILSPASIPEKPISPDKVIIHGIGVVSGLILCFFLIGILYLVNNKINNIQELEKLTQTTILGSVPKAPVKMENSQLIVNTRPKSAVSEALRSIRTNIQFMTGNESNPIISVTSTIGGEGKTFVSVNLAGIIATSDKKVILLDLDMRKPRVHLSFQDKNDDKGISTILINKYETEDCIRPTSISNLHYIPAGPTPPNPSELLLDNNFSTMLDKLSKTYDVVILDTPPVGMVTDGILVMKKSDIALYIVRANYSNKKFIETLNRLHRENHLPSRLAVILNAVSSGSHYGYGYGYYNEGLIVQSKKNA